MPLPFPRALLMVAGLLLISRVGLGLNELRIQRNLQTTVDWQPAADVEAKAQADERAVLYSFSPDWCAPCRRMQRELFCDPETGRFVNESFVAARIEDGLEVDGLSDAEAAALRERFSVLGFPTLVVVRDGREVARRVGYEGRAGTLAFLEAAAGTP